MEHINRKPRLPGKRQAEREGMKTKLRKRCGALFTADGYKNVVCVVTGEMADGRKVWTECDVDGSPVNIEKQYFLQTMGNWSEFVRI